MATDKKKIVVALGGNALGKSPEEQLELVRKTAVPIIDLVEAGHEVVVAHGNGPQVGMINLAMSYAAEGGAGTSAMPFPECGAMSQGYIGYHLQNALQAELNQRKMNVPAATIITQVVVDKEDPAFKNPTKPIGAFYSEEDAKKIQAEKGFVFKEDAGRGFRRVVASPLPIDVVEIETVRTLVNAGQLVITVGGGGIPVYRDGNGYTGIPAVIDKDFASAKIAELLDADYLIILTAVEKVAINFGKSNEKWLETLSLEEAQQYIKEGHFAPGSMLPKVEAAMAFAKSKSGRRSLITSLECAKAGIEGKTGTVIM